MFEWLEQEIDAIKTPRFHVVDGPADYKLQEAIAHSVVPLPVSYKEFVLKFGNAKLYRRVQNDSYSIGVFAAPREAALGNRTYIYHLGFHDGAGVYVKPVGNSNDFPIFEYEDGCEEKVAQNFEEWLEKSCSHARRKYRKIWTELLRGPIPFSREEEAIIDIRRHIQWRLLGVDEAGKCVFEVSNASKGTLPVITVGVRTKDKRLNGAVRLNVGHISPGQTALVRVDCYRGLVSPNEIEAFPLPDPKPEDRDYYLELKKT